MVFKISQLGLSRGNVTQVNLKSHFVSDFNLKSQTVFESNLKSWIFVEFYLKTCSIITKSKLKSIPSTLTIGSLQNDLNLIESRRHPRTFSRTQQWKSVPRTENRLNGKCIGEIELLAFILC